MGRCIWNELHSPYFFLFCYNLHPSLMFLSSYDLYGYELPIFCLSLFAFLAWASRIAIMSNVKTFSFHFSLPLSWVLCFHGASANHILFDHTHAEIFMTGIWWSLMCFYAIYIPNCRAWNPHERREWLEIFFRRLASIFLPFPCHLVY